MKSPSRPLPVWLKWLMRLFGVILIGYSVLTLSITALALWLLMHAKEGILARSGMLLAEVLGRLVGGILLLLLGGWLMRRSWRKSAPQPETIITQAVGAPGTPPPVPQIAASRPRSAHKVNYSSCNVLQVGTDRRQLWQFDARGGGFKLNREHTIKSSERLPSHIVTKTWRSLWQSKLNIAWLPPEKVFLRVLQLPKADLDETLPMVELQLEKLSPLPVTQIVWTVHALPQAGDLQTLVVVIASRALVEEFLGKLENERFLADRLEVPVLDKLQSTAINDEGAWIFPDPASDDNALVAWWHGGTLQNLGLIHAPAGPNRPAALKEQLFQMAWAGEFEGWLTSQPRWHLVADAGTAEQWLPPLRDGLGEAVEVVTPLPVRELAVATALRAAQADSKASLLPQEFAVRYQQQFVDRLWMRGLFGIGAVYILAVLVYFVALQVLLFRVHGAEGTVANLSQPYTNAMQLKGTYQILQDRQELKYAALDCWKATAELLVDSLTLQSLDFTEGRKLTLSGTANADKVGDVITFNSGMKRAAVNGQTLFSKVDTATWRKDSGGNTVLWNFACELNRVESP